MRYILSSNKMSEWIKKLRQRSKENSKNFHNRTSMYNRSNSTSQVDRFELNQMRRFGVSKLQNIIQKVLASHVQKVQEKQESGVLEIKPKQPGENEQESANIDPMLEALKDSTNQDEKEILENEEDKKFFKLMKRLLINGTIPK